MITAPNCFVLEIVFKSRNPDKIFWKFRAVGRQDQQNPRQASDLIGRDMLPTSSNAMMKRLNKWKTHYGVNRLTWAEAGTENLRTRSMTPPEL